MEDTVKRFLRVDLPGYGVGYGVGYGYGYVDGFGYGCGSASGYANLGGYGIGGGPGSGCGCGGASGYGCADGSGFGSNYGVDEGGGCGFGVGDGHDEYIKTFNGQPVYYIDGLPTIIERIKGTAAQGYIFGSDLTLQPCYIVRHGDCFAHGDTLKEAAADAIAKWQETRPLDEKLAEFVERHPDLDKPYGDLFSWHHILTGSCELGRREWCKEHGYKPTDSITVRTFIEETVNYYGGDIIRQLANEYGMDIK